MDSNFRAFRLAPVTWNTLGYSLERKTARRFAKVPEKEIEEAFFYPSDLVNTKTNIPLRGCEEWWIYTSTLRVSVYIHHYSPPLRGIVVYYSNERCYKKSLTSGYFSAENKKKKWNADADILNNNLL